MTAEEIFTGKIAEKLNGNVDKAKSIGGIYEFVVAGEAGDETWTIDLTKDADFVTKGSSGNAQCTVTIKAQDLADIVDKKSNPQMAFMTGKLKVKGDMGLGLKLGSIL